MKTNAMPQVGANEQKRERRKHLRKGTFWLAQLQTPAGNFECRVMNLSPRGAKVAVDCPVAEKQSVTLIMEPLGDFLGYVAWRRSGCIGIRINEHCTTKTEIAFPRWVSEDTASVR